MLMIICFNNFGCNQKYPGAAAPGYFMVDETGLEPALPKEHAPKACAYTNSATRPYQCRPFYSIWEQI